MRSSNSEIVIRKHNLLFDSSSLKELLGSSTNLKDRTITSKATLDTIKTILKQETGSSGLKRNTEFGKRKKHGKKSKPNRTKATSLLTEFDTFTSLQRASALRFSVNNVHEYAVDFHVPREDVHALEKNYSVIKVDINNKSKRLHQGFEQLTGQESNEINFEDAQLLATFGEIDIDVESLKMICFHCIVPRSEDSSDAEPLKIDFHLFVAALKNFCFLRHMGLCLAEIRGWFRRSDNDDSSQHSVESKPSSVHSLNISQSMPQFHGSKMQDEISVLSYGSGAHSSYQSYTLNDSSTPLRARSQPEGGGGPITGSIDTWGGDSSSMMTNSILPPVLRLKRKQSLNANKKKLLAKAGFNESLIRTTPRVLKSNINEKVDVHSLRWELEMAQEGIKQLDRLVDSNIAWVQSNCDMSSAMAHFSSRTIRKCKHMAAERIFNVLVEYQEVTMSWAFQIWNKYRKYLQVVDCSKKYCKIKSIEILNRTIYSSLFRQYARGWRPWKKLVQRAIFFERTAAAVEIQKICRGFLGRIYRKRKLQSKKVVFIQCMYRKWKARRVVNDRYQQRIDTRRSMAAANIQTFLRGRVSIWRAKEEAQRRRRVKAAIKIQKIGRGNHGRRKFSRKLLDSQSMGSDIASNSKEQFSDLDSIAANSLASQSNAGSLPSTARSVSSRTSKVTKPSSVRTSILSKKKGATNDSNKSSTTSAATAKGKKSENKAKSITTKDQKPLQSNQLLSTVIPMSHGDSLHSKEDSDQFVGSEVGIAAVEKTAIQNVGSLLIPRIDKSTPQNSSRRSEHSAGSSRVHGSTNIESARKVSPQSSRKPSPGLSREAKPSHGQSHTNASQGSHSKSATTEKHSHSNTPHINAHHGSNNNAPHASHNIQPHPNTSVSHSSHSKQSTAEKRAHGGSSTTVSKPKSHTGADSSSATSHSNTTHHSTSAHTHAPEHNKKRSSIVKDSAVKVNRPVEETPKEEEKTEKTSRADIEAQEKRRIDEELELLNKKLLEAQQEKLKEEARKGPDVLPEKTSETAPDQTESHILLQQSRASSP
eukprot:gene23919-31045_t